MLQYLLTILHYLLAMFCYYFHYLLTMFHYLLTVHVDAEGDPDLPQTVGDSQLILPGVLHSDILDVNRTIITL